MAAKSKETPTFLPRIRVVCGNEIAIGPGKAELLGFVHSTGSIAEAAKRMGMSYMRAWMLIRTMEKCFKRPLVEKIRGGAKGGGARLTETGETVLALYKQIETDSQQAAAASWRMLRVLLRN